jgi:ribosome-binding protein aMBF1 (putative translation factor)
VHHPASIRLAAPAPLALVRTPCYDALSKTELEATDMQFGKRLHELRTAKWMTLEKLARKIGSSKGYLSGVENGKVGPPTDKNVRKLARFLGQSEIEFLKLAYIDKLPQELKNFFRYDLLPKPSAQ